jgi:hypothetical protein
LDFTEGITGQIILHDLDFVTDPFANIFDLAASGHIEFLLTQNPHVSLDSGQAAAQ